MSVSGVEKVNDKEKISNKLTSAVFPQRPHHYYCIGTNTNWNLPSSYSIGSFSVASVDSSHDTFGSSSIDPIATYQEGLNEMNLFENEMWG